jgi:anthranilate phosphoribosyltransferase
MELDRLLSKVREKQDLSVEESKEAVFAMMTGNLNPTSTSDFLIALHQKGETSNELAGFALGMLEQAVPVSVDAQEMIDVCGTGGDRKGSFNISTVTAFIIAGAGIPVVKHGNRCASSNCGSADLLEALGIRFRLTPQEIPQALEHIRFAFLFAPDFHPATKSVAMIRKQLGRPTIFNLLGPLTNPARPGAQLIGVYDRKALSIMAEAIRIIHSMKRAIFVHSLEGFDEATTFGTFLVHSSNGQARNLSAQEYGFRPGSLDDLRGGSPRENAEIALRILQGERSSRRDTVVLNAFLATKTLYPDRPDNNVMKMICDSLDSGAALRVVRRLQEMFPGESS